jgi:DNA-binding response OmpR family regulator
VLSDLDSPIEATKALLQGADDYVTKPFDLGELEARIRAILRRYQGAVPTRIFHVGDLTVDDSVKEVRRGGQLIRLSPTEYDLLKLFIRRPGKVLSHQQIIRAVWPQKPFVTSGDVIKYISLLREKLELDPEHPQLIVTVRGFGYMLERRAVERQAEPKGAHR